MKSQYDTSVVGVEQGFELIHTLSRTYQTITLGSDSLYGFDELLYEKNDFVNSQLEVH